LLDRRISYPLWAGFAALVALAASSILSISGQAQTGSRTGKELFEKRCGGCHALDRDKEGPRLGGVYGREAASVPSFEYSTALKKSNLKWTEETLEKWLIDPEKLVPENDMTFHVESADERREIISYLKEKSGK
jgi:cytochrome c